jgi:hypothetical protein
VQQGAGVAAAAVDEDEGLVGPERAQRREVDVVGAVGLGLGDRVERRRDVGEDLRHLLLADVGDRGDGDAVDGDGAGVAERDAGPHAGDAHRAEPGGAAGAVAGGLAERVGAGAGGGARGRRLGGEPEGPGGEHGGGGEQDGVERAAHACGGDEDRRECAWARVGPALHDDARQRRPLDRGPLPGGRERDAL